jgi:hypothetical protein
MQHVGAGGQVELGLLLLAGVPSRSSRPGSRRALAGTWVRDLDTLDATMRFENADGAWTGAFDSERLRVEGIPFTEVVFDPPVVRLRLVGDATTTEFEGRVVDDSLVGTLVENGATGSFAFARSAEATSMLREEEVRFRNGEVELAGTLILPPGDEPQPAVCSFTARGRRDGGRRAFSPGAWPVTGSPRSSMTSAGRRLDRVVGGGRRRGAGRGRPAGTPSSGNRRSSAGRDAHLRGGGPHVPRPPPGGCLAEDGRGVSGRGSSSGSTRW